MTYRYAMIANKLDDRAIPQRLFVQSEISRCTYLGYPAEKECINPRSPVNCSFRSYTCNYTTAPSTFCFHLDGLPLPAFGQVRVCSAEQGRSTWCFCFCMPI